MEEIFLSQRLKKILAKNKQKLEKRLNVSIEVKGAKIIIDGEAYNEYISLKVFDALELSFDVETALSLLKHDVMLEKINLKDVVRPQRLKQVMGRIIGQRGKAKQVMSELSECAIVVKDNIIAVIGEINAVDAAARAIIALARGAPHSTIYSILEKNKRKMREARELGEFEDKL